MRPTQAVIDLAALRRNAAIARSLAGGAQVMAVVKANAYGHGSIAVARNLQDSVDAYAVACLEEAAALRAGGVTLPILLLEGVFDSSEVAEAVALECWMSIVNKEQLSWLAAADPPAPARCWMKVDTGMHRLGVPRSDAVATFETLQACANCADSPVLYTHLASADNLHNRQTSRQLAAFDALPIDAPRSVANSAGLLAWPDHHHEWVRPGYLLYGYSPLPAADQRANELVPAMTFTSQVTAVRDVAIGESVGYGGNWVATRPSRIATVSAGYGDGYPRQAPNGTPVLIGGQRAILAGRVSMDMMTVDITDLPDVAIGATVELWGTRLPLQEIANRCGTVGYELLARMPARTPRIYLNEDQQRLIN